VTPAHRIVSLIPATTELLFAIGAGDAVVGRTTWCDYPAEARAVPDLGDGIAPNIEAVLGQRPDLVLLYPSGRNAAVAERLRSMGIATVQLRTDLLADVPRVGSLLGQLAGREREAAALKERFESALAQATVAAPATVPSVFLLVWAEPPMTVGAGSYLSELLRRAGGRNTYVDLPTSSGQVSIESVVARKPDAILVLGDSTPAFAARPEWQAVAAVRERRFVFASGSQFAHPGPRAPDAIRALARALVALP
jgi:iron complex transport system substrate-binding protein